jgi:hypothetical protein
LIDEAIKDEVYDVVNFESHAYIVKEDKIGYIEHDNIIYNVTYSYQTMLAYLLKHEKGRISLGSRDNDICIRIKCGNFSYAEIPRQFQYIMGVTDTLVTLSDPEKESVDDISTSPLLFINVLRVDFTSENNENKSLFRRNICVLDETTHKTNIMLNSIFHCESKFDCQHRTVQQTSSIRTKELVNSQCMDESKQTNGSDNDDAMSSYTATY